MGNSMQHRYRLAFQPSWIRPYRLARQDFRRLQRRLKLPHYALTELNCTPNSSVDQSRRSTPLASSDISHAGRPTSARDTKSTTASASPSMPEKDERDSTKARLARQ